MNETYEAHEAGQRPAMDLKISGSSTMPGGVYNRVSVSGAGKIQGDVTCRTLACSGSTKIDGRAVCEQDVSCSGAVRITGDLACRELLKCSGSLQCGGELSARDMQFSGSVKADGALKADTVHCSGSLCAASVHCGSFHGSGCHRITGDLEAEQVRISGISEIDGLLNAEDIEITASPRSRIGNIGGSSIRVVRPEIHGLLRFFRRGSSDGLRTHTIEGDRIDLEYVTADVVRGKSVRIGPGCHIRRVEYSESLEAEPHTVEEAVSTVQTGGEAEK